MIERVAWRARQTPLEPVAVAATGGAAIALAQRLLELGDEELQPLRGVSWAQGLALEGDTDKLPWVDGAVYLGHDARVSRLLLPCALEPDVPLDLWARAFERQLQSELAAPLAVLPKQGAVVSLANARPIAREKLEGWLATQSENHP